MLESLYEEALFQELKIRNIPVQAQVRIPVIYKKLTLRESMRLDLLVNQKIIIEVKATEQEHAVHKAQVLTYLRLTGLKLGLMINFGQSRLIDGFIRVVNNLSYGFIPSIFSFFVLIFAVSSLFVLLVHSSQL